MKEFNCCVCEHLEAEEVDLIDNRVTASFEVVEDFQLVENMSGICLTGQRGKCPLGYNCGDITSLVAIPPLYVLIEPKEVKK